MNKVTIKAKSPSVVQVVGNIECIERNRRACRMMKDLFSCAFFDDRIELSGLDDFQSSMNRLKRICAIANCEVEFSKETDSVLNDYLLEERKFEDFSKKALEIRNNNCDYKDFESFKNVLLDKMPNRTLYPLQLLSAYHLAFSQNACNFSVPGAGKTSIVYAAYSYLSNLPESDLKKIDKLLIIGPLSSFGPWENEYEECFGKPVNSKRLSGGVTLEEKKQYLYKQNPPEVTLMSYRSVISLSSELQVFLKNHRTMVVLDEAHRIKNYSGGIIANSVLSLSTECSARVVLTGTPAPNGYEDLYNLFGFIWPGRNIIRFNPGQLKDMSKNSNDIRVDTLVNQISPYFIRIKKSDLGIPPAIIHPPVIVPMKNSQRRLYDYVEGKAIAEIGDSDNSNIGAAIRRARVVRLMQAATNPNLLKKPLKEYAAIVGGELDLFDDESYLLGIEDLIPDEIPAKFEKALELVKSITENNEKVVIWANFIQTIDDLSRYFSECGIYNKVLYGGTPIAADDVSEEDEEYENTREAIIKEFNRTDSDLRVIIANPFAVSESISLHKACHHAIYLERSFNAAHFIQSKDRIHRYGLPPDVSTHYYYLISADSIDETIDERLTIKENRMNEIMESMPIPLFSNVTIDEGDEDIKALMRDYARRIKTM